MSCDLAQRPLGRDPADATALIRRPSGAARADRTRLPAAAPQVPGRPADAPPRSRARSSKPGEGGPRPPGLGAPWPPACGPEASLRAQARRLGLGERTLRGLLAAHRSTVSRPCREVLFAVALARTAHPLLPRISLDRFVREWVRAQWRAGAQEAWTALATHGAFWTLLNDPLRHRAARILRRPDASPGEQRRALVRLLGSPRFHHADGLARLRALEALHSSSPTQSPALLELEEPPSAPRR